jgi:drug/metabolite transporter (DMT)-like permease
VTPKTQPAHGMIGITLVVVAACAYGTVPIFAKTAFAQGVSLPAFLALRFAMAAVLLWAAVPLVSGKLPRGADAARLFALGAAGYGGQSAAFFFALERLPASTTALLLYTYPAIVTVAAAIFLRDRLTARKIGAVLVAFAGTSLVVGGRTGHVAAAGVAFALLSASIYSAYILFGSSLFRRVPPVASAAVVMSGTAATFLVYAIAARSLALPADAAQAVTIGTVALVGTAVPVLAFLAGMPRIGPARASILSTFEPAVTVLLAAAVLGEPFALAQIAGALSVLGSVAMLEYGRSDEPAPM